MKKKKIISLQYEHVAELGDSKDIEDVFDMLFVKVSQMMTTISGVTTISGATL